MLGTLMAVLDVSLVNVALPSTTVVAGGLLLRGPDVRQLR